MISQSDARNTSMNLLIVLSDIPGAAQRLALADGGSPMQESKASLAFAADRRHGSFGSGRTLVKRCCLDWYNQRIPARTRLPRR